MMNKYANKATKLGEIIENNRICRSKMSIIYTFTKQNQNSLFADNDFPKKRYLSELLKVYPTILSQRN